jgi:sporulation protein YlmC with PRC-barrel domain/CBS domain-containing protein
MAIISTEQLHDMDMVDAAGNRVGAVKDVLVDASSGRIKYAVVAPGQSGLAGALGIGERLVAIPFALLRLDSGQAVLPRDASALMAAPAYARTHPPSFDDGYQNELAQYWGMPDSARELDDLGGVTAGDVAAKAMAHVRANMGLREIAGVLIGQGVDAAQVIGEEGEVVGVVTARDVIVALARGAAEEGAASGHTADEVSQAPVAEQPRAISEGEAKDAVGVAATSTEGVAGEGEAEPSAPTTASGPQATAGPTTRPRPADQSVEGGIACPSCGFANRSDAVFCRRCGTRLAAR